MIEQHYCTPKHIDAFNPWVYESFSRGTLDLQSSLFKMTMKTQASKAMEELKHENLITKLWRQLAMSSLLIVHFF